MSIVALEGMKVPALNTGFGEFLGGWAIIDPLRRFAVLGGHARLRRLHSRFRVVVSTHDASRLCHCFTIAQDTFQIKHKILSSARKFDIRIM
uniref:Uncharacterized protein n=1 Tax=Physcomitrium patens TaxID=3218 RepID=A0A2K1KF17_PHYPA|nr:hypothetical protein PHYPA_008742 [Physcomitrium patens]